MNDMLRSKLFQATSSTFELLGFLCPEHEIHEWQAANGLEIVEELDTDEARMKRLGLVILYPENAITNGRPSCAAANIRCAV